MGWVQEVYCSNGTDYFPLGFGAGSYTKGPFCSNSDSEALAYFNLEEGEYGVPEGGFTSFGVWQTEYDEYLDTTRYMILVKVLKSEPTLPVNGVCMYGYFGDFDCTYFDGVESYQAGYGGWVNFSNNTMGWGIPALPDDECPDSSSSSSGSSSSGSSSSDSSSSSSESSSSESSSSESSSESSSSESSSESSSSDSSSSESSSESSSSESSSSESSSESSSSESSSESSSSSQ
jgi:hypothetical protein